MPASTRNFAGWHLTLLALFLSLTAPSPAQSTQDDLESRLLKQPLYLRGSWQGKQLKFDAAGVLLNHCSTPKSDGCPGSFTLSGVDISSVDIEPGKLILEGHRAWIRFQPSGLQRNGGKDSIRIEIASPPGGEYGPVLDKVFANGLPDLTPSLPDIWQVYAYKAFLQQDISHHPRRVPSMASSGPLTNESPSPTQKTGIIAPVVIFSETPDTSEAASKTNYNATVVINFVVGTDGKPYDIRIVKPAGLGLDEKAAGAVLQYKFKPATKDGVPVNVELNIQVSFANSFRLR